MSHINLLNQMRRLRVATFCAAFLGLPNSAALAADAPASAGPPQPAVNDRIERAWEFLFAPYFVGANIVGTTRIGRLPATDLDVGTDDILKNLRFGAMFRSEVLYRQTAGAFLDVAYMNLGSATTGPLTGGRVKVGVGQLIAEGMVFYRPYSTPQTTFDVYAGGRYWDVSLDVNATGTVAGNFDIDRGDNWIDPVIGVRGMHRFNENWSVNARADIGGFGIASDFTWNVQGGVGYHFNDTWSVHFQYKALDVDYDNDKQGTQRFAYDTITHGPLLGIAARF